MILPPLETLFANYKYGDDLVLPADDVRQVLSTLYARAGRFQMGEIDDATEASEWVDGVMYGVVYGEGGGRVWGVMGSYMGMGGGRVGFEFELKKIRYGFGSGLGLGSGSGCAALHRAPPYRTDLASHPTHNPHPNPNPNPHLIPMIPSPYTYGRCSRQY